MILKRNKNKKKLLSQIVPGKNLTPLMIAADLGDKTLVQQFVFHGTEIAQTNRYGQSAISIAQQRKHI